MQKHTRGLELPRHVLPEHLSPGVSLQLSILCLSFCQSLMPFSAQARELQAATLSKAKCSMLNQAAAPRPQTRLCSSSATVASLFTFQGNAVHRDRWSAIPTAAAAKDATPIKAPSVQAATAKASNVKAAFAKAGLSQHAVDHIVKQYPYYLRWDVEDKLLPAIQSWQQELGASFPSEVERVPVLLLTKPAEELVKNQYLASIGIKSPERLRKRNSGLFRQPLTSMQSKLACLQQHGFSTAQTLSLVEKHPDVLQCTSEHLGELLRLVEDMFGCADRGTLCDVMLSCNQIGLCNQSLDALHRNFTHFCAFVEVDHKQMKRAWKHGVFTVSPTELDDRLDSIAAQLSATTDEAKAVVRSMPVIANLLPKTVGLHVTQLLGLGFSHEQVKSMCLRQPVLLTYSYKSQLQANKWAFLTQVLRLSHDAIAACPHLLMSSLPTRLGPRWEYLLQLRLHGVIAFTGAHDVLNGLVFMTDSRFRAVYTSPHLRVYDEHFQTLWQMRWNSLLVDQQLSFQDIADNPDVLRISAKDM